MTITARKVLHDCEKAYELLDLEENEQKFRLLWVSCISLLRAVGHVLRKVDCANNELLRNTVTNWWKKINAEPECHPIFFQFIETERNNILKEYEVGIFSGEIEVLVGEHGEPFTLAATEFCPMSYGLFEGEDCREVAFIAINWWKRQLQEIEESKP